MIARPIQVIAGAENDTAYVINNCSEGFYFNSQSWILIAGPYVPSAQTSSSATAATAALTAAADPAHPAAAAAAAAPAAGVGNGGASGAKECTPSTCTAASRRLLQEGQGQPAAVYDINQSPRDRPVSPLALEAAGLPRLVIARPLQQPLWTRLSFGSPNQGAVGNRRNGMGWWAFACIAASSWPAVGLAAPRGFNRAANQHGDTAQRHVQGILHMKKAYGIPLLDVVPAGRDGGWHCGSRHQHVGPAGGPAECEAIRSGGQPVAGRTHRKLQAGRWVL